MGLLGSRGATGVEWVRWSNACVVGSGVQWEGVEGSDGSDSILVRGVRCCGVWRTAVPFALGRVLSSGLWEGWSAGMVLRVERRQVVCHQGGRWAGAVVQAVLGERRDGEGERGGTSRAVGAAICHWANHHGK